MKLLHRHIGSHVISMSLLVTLMLGGLLAFINFLAELKDIGTLNYGVSQAFTFVVLTLTHQLYPFFPIAVLIGCLIGLGQLASNSELIVMRSAGVSKVQITASVIRATIFMLIFATFFGEVISPALKSFADRYKSVARLGGDPADWGRQGFWLRSGENFIHVDKALPSGELQGVSKYQFSGQQLAQADFAKTGYYDQHRWRFKDIALSVFANDAVQTKTIPEQAWNVIIDPKLVSVNEVESDQSSLFTIHHYIHYLKHSGMAANSYQFDFWTRLLQPLATLIMIGLAVPFIFGPLRTVTMGLRILIGVVIGFGFYTVNAFLGPFSLVYDMPPFWAAATPLLIVGIIDGILLWRVN